jgi:ketosteroid isomerase-like protein
MMKRVASTALVALAFCCLRVGLPADKPQANDPQMEKEVRAMEKQRVDALLKGDAETMKEIMSDDFTYITHTGLLRLKVHRLRDLQAKTLRYTLLSNDIVDVRLYGDTALVHGFTTRKGEAPGRRLDGTFRFTRLWVKEQGHWHLVHTHISTTSAK